MSDVEMASPDPEQVPETTPQPDLDPEPDPIVAVDGVVMQVTVEDPRYAEEELIDIPGLGSVPNYSTKDLEPYQVALFVQQGYTWPEDNHLRIIKDEYGRYESNNATAVAEEGDQ